MKRLLNWTRYHLGVLAVAGTALCAFSILALVEGDTPLGLLLLTFGVLGVYSAGVGISPPKRLDVFVWIIGGAAFIATAVVSIHADERGLAILSFVVGGAILMVIVVAAILHVLVRNAQSR